MSMTFPVKVTEANGFHRKNQVSVYFQEMINDYLNAEEESCLFLPSLLDLAKALDCSTLDIYAALAEQKRQGFDFFFLHPSSPITFWLPSKMSLHEPTALQGQEA